MNSPSPTPILATARSRWTARQTAIVGTPGESWTYNGGATALLARLIARGTGRALHDYAKHALFEPLGLGPTEWGRDARGVEFAASGLRMAPRDLARIGVMLLANGEWQGQPVVPADWLQASFAPAVGMPDGRHYGYHWYLGANAMADGSGVRWEETVSAIGNGGQRLYLLPRLGLVVAITAGNYDAPDQWRPPITVLRDVLLPALQS